MTKKRQQDFAKTQLKPGRLLNKRKNVTQTSFKAKKILLPKKQIKGKAEFTIEDCLKKIKSGGSEKDKAINLNDLNKRIIRQSESLHLHLHEIFENVLDYIRDPHDDIREAALKVIICVLESTDDLQLYSSVNIINNSISAAMKHPNYKITPTSLALIDCMLRKHPKLICHNISILSDLLPTGKKHYTRKNVTGKDSYQYSNNGDINALGHVNAFIKNILKSKADSAKHEREENDVYWDGEEPLYLEIFAGGGLKPVDIEKPHSVSFHHEANIFDEYEAMTECIDCILKLIHNNFTQILGSEPSADDNIFRCDAVSDLSILFQLMCNVAEWAEQISYKAGLKNIKAFLLEKIFTSSKKRFPFELHAVITATSLQPLALLNISICHLYLKMLYSEDSCEDDDVLVEKSLKRFFSFEKGYSSEVKCQCIPLFAKIVHLYCKIPGIPDILYLILKQLVMLLKIRSTGPNKKALISLLVTLSLDPYYSFWIDSEPMELWYEWLFNQLKENIHEMDKKLLVFIRKIANQRHTSFMKNLDFSVVKPLLKNRNDDVRETAIFLLYNLEITGELLKNIFDTICLDTFPKKFAVRLIRLLVCRFNEMSASEKVFVDFTQFLLNVAIDSYNLYKEDMIDFEANEYTKALQSIQDGHTFNIFPSLLWKEHKVIFDVCLRSLRQLPVVPVSIIMIGFFKELLDNTTHLPIHSVLALLKLDIPETPDKYYCLLLRDLNFSCLLTISVLTQMSMEDEWYRWNVVELMESINLTRKPALDFLDVVHQGHFGKPEGLVVFHLLRVLKFFIEKQLLDCESENIVNAALQIMQHVVEDRCFDKTMKYQSLYKQLCNFFISKLCP